MKSPWPRLADQLDRVPSQWGMPIMVVGGAFIWFVAVQLIHL